MSENVYLLRIPGRSDYLSPWNTVEIAQSHGSGKVVALRVENAPCKRLVVAVAKFDAVSIPGVYEFGSDNYVGMRIAVDVGYLWT